MAFCVSTIFHYGILCFHKVRPILMNLSSINEGGTLANFFSDPLDFNGAKTDETWILKVYTMQKTVNSEQISQHCNHRFRGSSMNKTWQFLYLWFFMDEFSSNVDGDTSKNQHSKGSPVRVPRHHPLLSPAFFFLTPERRVREFQVWFNCIMQCGSQQTVSMRHLCKQF